MKLHELSPAPNSTKSVKRLGRGIGSGTGKTRLVKLFAKTIGAKMKLVPVRPDWSDSSDLFGHTDLSGKFQQPIPPNL